MDTKLGKNLTEMTVIEATLHSHTRHVVAYNDTLTAVDWSLGANAVLTFGAGNIATLEFSNPVSPGWLILELIQDAVGGRVVTAWGSNILWAAGSPITLAGAAANRKDLLLLYFNGTNYLTSFGTAYS